MIGSIKLNRLSLNGWLLSSLVVGALILPTLFMDGMFLDATLYTTVARNLREGIGTFWFPKFDTKIAGLDTFHEQPPFGIWLISLSFKLFGDTIFAERFFVLIVLLINIFLIHKIWLLIFDNISYLKHLSWLSVIYWGSIPLTFWSFSNNMLENIVSMFTLLAVYSFLKSYTNKLFLFWTLIACVSIIAGFMTKGFPALFPIGVPLIYFFVFRNTKNISLKKIIYQYIFIFVSLLIFSIVIYLYPEAKESMNHYLIDRAFFRITQQPTSDSHFYITYRLLLELLPPLILTVLIIFLSYKKFQTSILSNLKKHQQYSIFFFIIGLSGSLPLMLTMVQKGFYMVPSFPFFAITFGIVSSQFIIPIWSYINTTFSNKSITRTLIILNFLLLIITISLAGTPKRDKELLEDIKKVAKIIPLHDTITIENRYFQTEWSFICYLGRIGQISVEGLNCHRKHYIKFKSDTSISCQNFEKLPYHFNLIELYKNIKEQ